MAVNSNRLVTINNIAMQTVGVTYKALTQVDATQSRSSVTPTASGILNIAPSKTADIEQIRVDFAQLEELRRKHLITYAVS